LVVLYRALIILQASTGEDIPWHGEGIVSGAINLLGAGHQMSVDQLILPDYIWADGHLPR
jgi:hypothetical protein